MAIPWGRDRQFNQAFLASLGVHALVALMIPTAIILSGNTSSIETLSFVRLMHVETRPEPIVREARATAVVVSPVTHIVDKNTAAPTQHRTTARSTSAQISLNSAPSVGTVSRDGTAIAQTGASAAPSAAPQVAVPSEAPRQRVGGYMPLGAEDPIPVLDPSVHTALVALNVHVTLLVSVDENGHTTRVAFSPTTIDATTQARILALLNNAEWDPATCGAGVPCAAQATITLP